MRVLLIGLVVLASGAGAQYSSFPLSPLLPVDPFAVFPETEDRFIIPIRKPSFVGHRYVNLTSTNPCSPSPCGSNTQCEVLPEGIAQCNCLTGFVRDASSVNACRPDCIIDYDCPYDYRCLAGLCVPVCEPGYCGINAECDARNHRATCKCPSNYRGDPHTHCTKDESTIIIPFDPSLGLCNPSPCGFKAECRVSGDKPVCTCPIGYEGDPLTNCTRGECSGPIDCPDYLDCQTWRCIDPCPSFPCGESAHCKVVNHRPICFCPKGYVGDPFNSCRPELCNPSPCGRNTICKVNNGNVACTCIENYIGNPLTGCEPECVRDSDCRSSNMGCRNNICVNPCRHACGEGAYCEVRNHRAVCSCPQYYQGDPYSRCYAECTAHAECSSYQACFQLQCVNPCEGACGTGADCKVENHRPVCSCPSGYTGNPFKSCQPITPVDVCNPNPCGSQADCKPGPDRSGNDRPICTCPTGFIGNPLFACQRGECQSHNECPNHQACYAYTCQNPCYYDGQSVCGRNADCTVRNHQSACSCPPGYIGNPLTECRVARGGAFSMGRSKEK